MNINDPTIPLLDTPIPTKTDDVNIKPEVFWTTITIATLVQHYTDPH